MRTILVRSFFILTLTVGALTTHAPTATAAPGSDIWTRYYTCDMVWLGEKFRGCDSTGYNTGVLSGYFKEIESCSCEGTTCTTTWYQWNGTTWINIGHTEPPHAC